MEPMGCECPTFSLGQSLLSPQFPYLQTETHMVHLPAGLLGLNETTLLSLGVWGADPGGLGPGSPSLGP